MSTDRAATLRNAEKLIRQGKLDAAIVEYLRIVENEPGDWTTANALGDLYGRAGQPDKAADVYLRVAEGLGREGPAAKAALVYKKILKLKPDDERALVGAADLHARQGQRAEARTHLEAVLEQRRTRGDAKGAAEIRVRIGALDPDDFTSRLGAARARVELGETAAALDEIKAVAASLEERGRSADAIAALLEAFALAPEDADVRERLLHLRLASGDFAEARSLARSVAQFRRIAEGLEARGESDEARATLEEASRLNPEDVALRVELARAFVARGDVAAVARYITSDMAAGDPLLLLALGEERLRAGVVDEGLSLVGEALGSGAEATGDAVNVACGVGVEHPDAGYRVLELASAGSVAKEDWAGAAALWQRFATRVPHHVPALMRLVEISVDGGLEATLSEAQALLIDAYIETGAAKEARFVAEDLASREPEVKAHLDRLRHALVLGGDPDPDGTIAEWQSTQSLFSDDGASLEAARVSEDAGPGASALTEEAVLDTASRESTSANALDAPLSSFDLAVDSIDLAAIFGGLDEPAPAPSVASSPAAAAPAADALPSDAPVAVAEDDADPIEVDLSLDLNEITEPLPILAADSNDLDSVFAQLRTEATETDSADTAEQQYRTGLKLRAKGDLDGAAAALKQAARSPALRFATADLLGRLFVERGRLPEAIEWFGRAAEAPAPTAEEGHALLYEFAGALEKGGESARALAVLLELQAQAGGYRDVESQIDRLGRIQAGG